MSLEASAYNIVIRKAVIDTETFFEARVKELPDVIEYADSWDEAYELAIDTIETTAEHFEDRGKNMPAPTIPVDDYSGRITLRLPKTLHQATSEEAADEGISLNQHIVSVLAFNSGCTYGMRMADAKWWWPIEDTAPKATVDHARKRNVKVVQFDDYSRGYSKLSMCQ